MQSWPVLEHQLRSTYAHVDATLKHFSGILERLAITVHRESLSATELAGGGRLRSPFNEFFVSCVRLAPRHALAASELFDHYVEWCTLHHKRPLGFPEFCAQF
jgi:hypothetical protein